MIGFKELIVIGIIIILIFGTSKLKNMGGDLGSALKNFKKAVKDGDDTAKTEVVKKDDDSDKKA
jgi:TatA/E family protein of Tat protein translocase